jgi:hypothetical protein
MIRYAQQGNSIVLRPTIDSFATDTRNSGTVGSFWTILQKNKIERQGMLYGHLPLLRM